MIGTYLKQTKFSNQSREIEECRGKLAVGVGECHKVISLPSANRRWFHRVCMKPPEVCWGLGTGPRSASLPPSHGIPYLYGCVQWSHCLSTDENVGLKGMSSSTFPWHVNISFYFIYSSVPSHLQDCSLFLGPQPCSFLFSQGLILLVISSFSIICSLCMAPSTLPSGRHTFLLSRKPPLLSP